MVEVQHHPPRGKPTRETSENRVEENTHSYTLSPVSPGDVTSAT